MSGEGIGGNSPPSNTPKNLSLEGNTFTLTAAYLITAVSPNLSDKYFLHSVAGTPGDMVILSTGAAAPTVCCISVSTSGGHINIIEIPQSGSARANEA